MFLNAKSNKRQLWSDVDLIFTITTKSKIWILSSPGALIVSPSFILISFFAFLTFLIPVLCFNKATSFIRYRIWEKFAFRAFEDIVKVFISTTKKHVLWFGCLVSVWIFGFFWSLLWVLIDVILSLCFHFLLYDYYSAEFKLLSYLFFWFMYWAIVVLC